MFGILKVFAYSLFYVSFGVMMYAIVQLAKMESITLNKRNICLIAGVCLPFIMLIVLILLQKSHQEMERDSVAIKSICGEVAGYYPNSNQDVLSRQKSRSRYGSDVHYKMTLKVDNRRMIYLLPDNFHKIKVGEQACFEVLDGTGTGGAYTSEIIRVIEPNGV